MLKLGNIITGVNNRIIAFQILQICTTVHACSSCIRPDTNRIWMCQPTADKHDHLTKTLAN